MASRFVVLPWTVSNCAHFQYRQAEPHLYHLISGRRSERLHHSPAFGVGLGERNPFFQAAMEAMDQIGPFIWIRQGRSGSLGWVEYVGYPQALVMMAPMKELKGGIGAFAGCFQGSVAF